MRRGEIAQAKERGLKSLPGYIPGTAGGAEMVREMLDARGYTGPPRVHEFHGADDYTGNAFCECGEQR